MVCGKLCGEPDHFINRLQRVTVEELMEETLAARAEIAHEEFGEGV
jgi:hypothetical protein